MIHLFISESNNLKTVNRSLIDGTSLFSLGGCPVYGYLPSDGILFTIKGHEPFEIKQDVS